VPRLAYLNDKDTELSAVRGVEPERGAGEVGYVVLARDSLPVGASPTTLTDRLFSYTPHAHERCVVEIGSVIVGAPTGQAIARSCRLYSWPLPVTKGRGCVVQYANRGLRPIRWSCLLPRVHARLKSSAGGVDPRAEFDQALKKCRGGAGRLHRVCR